MRSRDLYTIFFCYELSEISKSAQNHVYQPFIPVWSGMEGIHFPQKSLARN